MKAALIAILAVLGIGGGVYHYSHSAPKAPAADLSGSAATGTIGLFGTLAPFGSFSFETAPIYTKVAVLGHQAKGELERHEITPDQAQALHDRALKAKSLTDHAVVACGEDEQTGKCTKNQADATRLLDQARAVLASP